MNLKPLSLCLLALAPLALTLGGCTYEERRTVYHDRPGYRRDTVYVDVDRDRHRRHDHYDRRDDRRHDRYERHDDRRDRRSSRYDRDDRDVRRSSTRTVTYQY